jgi:hypothetical protein
MVIHSDSVGMMLPFVVTFLVLTSVGMLAPEVARGFTGGKFRQGAKALRALAGLVAVYVLFVMAVSLLTPQKIGSAGQAYCMDIWCIGIEKVSPIPARNQIAYKVDVRIFSDADTVKTSGKGFSLFLVDERGRRFPMVKDPSVIPFDLSLDPGQSVNTSLTFVTAADARELFLTVRENHPFSPLYWVERLCVACDGSLLHKPTLLRVL